MPADQRNFNYSQYTDDNAVVWCIKADQNIISDTADFGGSACTGQPRFVHSRNHQPRKAIYQDATTFRTVTAPVFTPTAYAALTEGTSTLAVHVPGNTATVSYTLVKKVSERRPRVVIGRQDPDHA
jgi:trans-aconitate methyltransferase